MDWDDTRNFLDNLDNPHYRGLGWGQLRWMATTTLLGHYVPLTWVTLGLDYTLFGMNPTGYHLTSMLLHMANAVLFYFVTLRLLRAATSLPRGQLVLAAAVASLLFAVHPLRVESVVWLTERRDVLSGLFFLLTILTYLIAAEAQGPRRRRLLVASVGCYLLALASKSIVMTLPLILILLDIYPLERLRGGPGGWFGRATRPVWIEKVPYAILSLSGALVAYYVHTGAGIVTGYPLRARVGMAFYSLWFYIRKTLLPIDLSPMYELPVQVDPFDPPFLVSALGAISITVAVTLLGRAWPAGLVVWACYAILLAPVSGIIHHGFQLAADRYSYLPSLGLAVLVGAGVGVAARAVERGSVRPAVARLLAAAVAVCVLALAASTAHQVRAWRDGETLWRQAVAASPDCSLCHNNLGNALLRKDLPFLALEHFRAALALRPDRAMLHGNVGLALTRLGRVPEAAEQYQRVLDRYPDSLPYRIELATALTRMGRLTEAVEQQAVVVAEPGKVADEFRRVIELMPRAAIPRLGLFQAYLALGRIDLAREQYDALKLMDPALASSVSARMGTAE